MCFIRVRPVVYIVRHKNNKELKNNQLTESKLSKCVRKSHVLVGNSCAKAGGLTLMLFATIAGNVDILQKIVQNIVRKENLSLNPSHSKTIKKTTFLVDLGLDLHIRCIKKSEKKERKEVVFMGHILKILRVKNCEVRDRKIHGLLPKNSYIFVQKYP